MAVRVGGLDPFGPGNPDQPPLLYLFLRFLRYGWRAWGGPMSQLNLMYEEVVERDGWIDPPLFWKTLAVYQGLPGPESLEFAIYFGAHKRGRLGGLLAGFGFMLPGFLLVLLFASLYVQFSATAAYAQELLYGVKAAVVAVIAVAVVRLAGRSLHDGELWTVAVMMLAAGLLLPRVQFVLLLAAGAILVLVIHETRAVKRHQKGQGPGGAALLVPFGLLASYPALTATGVFALAWVNLQAGLLTFGGAYTVIPFLHEGAVNTHGWISEDGFLDAVAFASLVPGPLLSIATFVGYQAGGPLGAVLATLLVYAPAFLITILAYHGLDRIVDTPRLGRFLFGIVAAVLGFIAATAVRLAFTAYVDAGAMLIGLTAFALLLRRVVSVPIVVLGGGLVGVLIHAL